MIRVCKICGKEFEGRANASICSGACRLAAQRIYQKEYNLRNPEKAKASKRAYWNRTHNKEDAVTITDSDNLDLNFESVKPKRKKKKAKKKLPKYKGSKWAEVYSNSDRLTRIAMLSGELSKYEIADLSYGALSLIWDTEKYKRLLDRVLKIKKAEEQC